MSEPPRDAPASLGAGFTVSRAVAALALPLGLAACAEPPAAEDCGGDLRGVWRVDGAEAQRWHVIAGFERADAPLPPRAGDPSADASPRSPRRGEPTWEWYALFDEGALSPPPPPGMTAAPGAIDLPRLPPGATTLVGAWVRRYEQGARACVVSSPAVLTGCRGDRATLTASPPQPPADVGGCAAPPPLPARTWSLTRE